MSTPRRHPPAPRLKLLPLAALLAVLPVLVRPPALAGAEAETRIASAWEYDSNIFEDRSGKMAGGAGTLSLFSRLWFGNPAGGRSLLSYNLGYKAHHRLLQSDSLTAGDLLVNRLSAETERRLGGRWSAGGNGELKVRGIYRKNPFNLLSEEGYIRASAHGFLRARELRGGMLTLGYRFSRLDFETFETFNYRSHSPELRYARRLSGALSGAAALALTRRGYDRNVIQLGPDGVLIHRDSFQRDLHQQLDLSLSWSDETLATFIYSLQRNDSNSYGFSYWNNRFTLLYSRELPAGLFLNSYLFFELKRYSERLRQPLLVDLVTEENQNNGAVLRLSRPLGERLEAAATLSFYRNESSIRNLNFNKHLLSLGLSWRL